jgi:hypothetical protein
VPRPASCRPMKSAPPPGPAPGPHGPAARPGPAGSCPGPCRRPGRRPGPRTTGAWPIRSLLPGRAAAWPAVLGRAGTQARASSRRASCRAKASSTCTLRSSVSCCSQGAASLGMRSVARSSLPARSPATAASASSRSLSSCVRARTRPSPSGTKRLLRPCCRATSCCRPSTSSSSTASSPSSASHSWRVCTRRVRASVPRLSTRKAWPWGQSRACKALSGCRRSTTARACSGSSSVHSQGAPSGAAASSGQACSTVSRWARSAVRSRCTPSDSPPSVATRRARPLPGTRRRPSAACSGPKGAATRRSCSPSPTGTSSARSRASAGSSRAAWAVWASSLWMRKCAPRPVSTCCNCPAPWGGMSRPSGPSS